MSDYQYRRSYVAPALGVNFAIRPHLLSAGQWFELNQMRCSKGLVTEFPGWLSILASSNVGGFCSLLSEYAMQDGTVKLMTAGPTKVQEFDTGTRLLVDKSGALSFAPTRDHPWISHVWNNIFYLTNPANGLHKYTGSGNVTAIGGAPALWNVRALKNHLCGFGVGSNPMTFRWAAEASETDWTSTLTNDAGQFDVVESSDRAVGLEPMHEDLVGYKERSIHGFSYVGGREVVGRRRMVSDVGLLGPYAISVFPDRHLFMGNPPDFYEYSGGSTVDNRYGSPMREKVFPDLHPTIRNRARTLTLPLTSEVLFAYPSLTATNDCDKVVVYNYKENHWYGPFNMPVSMMGFAKLSFATVIDSHSAIIDTVSETIDSYGTTTGESLRLFADASGNIHEVGASRTANGTVITRTMETGDLFLGADCVDSYGQPVQFPLGTVFNLVQVNLEVEDISGGNIEMSVGSRRDLNDQITWSDPFTIKSASSQLLEIPMWGIRPGRWFRLRFRLPNSEGVSLAGFQFLFSVAGVR